MGNKSDNRIREQVDRLGRPDEEMLEREIARHERNKLYKRLAYSILTALVSVVAAIIIITNLWVAVLQVDGSSMNPLLEMDEIVIATRTDNPTKGDVIAFYHNNKIYIKRVIAIGGDRVEINVDGEVFVNGTMSDEPYVNELSLGDCDIEFPFQVPSETFFVLGDNRGASQDSRNSRFGTVGKELLIGKVIFTVWPFSKIGNIT